MDRADVVIVGAGSAGCVLANRLSADPATRVVLVEAGGRDRSINIRVPLAFPKQFHTRLDWDFATEPEPDCDGRPLYIPRGRSLGGSSSMNAMLYVRGRPVDYALWEQAGAEGWGWDQVLPAFLKSEDNCRGASEFHGAGGELVVSEQRSPRALDADLLAACEAAGIPRVADYNGPEQDGASMFQVNQRDGRRWSAADAFLKPVMRRPNLEVVTNALVQRVELDGTRATGVTFRDRFRRTRTVHAGEVVLAAGAIGSPQLLLLSGVGPADHLAEVGIPVRHELDGVGRNLQDHPFVSVIWEVRDTDTLFGADRPKALAEWLLRRTGKLSSTAAEAVAFVRTRPGLPAPDIQFHMGALFYEDHGQEEFNGHAAVIAPTLLTPKARGRVWLRSADPADKPGIFTATLSEREDVESLLAGMELAREVAAQEPLASKVVRELKPGPGVLDRAELEADLRRRVQLIYHPVGTCSIGSVVDPQLRVVGMEGLRVVDASVMPVIPGGNTNAPTIMVAERAAELMTSSALPAAAVVAA